MSSVLTCLTCQVKFHDTELHRDHFKGDWHRYNLKRKVSSLPIVSSGAFDERRAAHEKQVKVEEGRNKTGDYCVACGKCFKNNKAYENHIQSKKHQEMILKFERPPAIIKPEMEELEEEDEDDMEIEEVDSDEWEDDPIEITDCLFDSHHSSSLEKNLSYMMTNYSFFLPDPEFITDLEGLMGYLGAKVGQGHMCLWCNKRFSSVRDVQRHMVDTGHCKLRFDTEAMMEYDEWYDYTASYPDQENPEGEVDLNVLDDSGFELVLPSGTKIGHRSLLRYYKQSLNPNRSLVLADNRSSSARYSLLSTYKSVGWTGSSGQDAVVKARDLNFLRKLRNKQNLKVGMKGNNQKHFKDRNGMCM